MVLLILCEGRRERERGKGMEEGWKRRKGGCSTHLPAIEK